MDSQAPQSLAAVKPSPGIISHLVTIDATLSHHLHLFTKPILPHFILLLLEYSADFRLFFPISLSLLYPISLYPIRFSFLVPFLLGLLLDLSFVGIVKIIVRRARPHYNPNMTPAVSADNFSFPSGHSSRVFFVAAFVWLSAAYIEGADVNLGIGTFLEKWIGGYPEQKVSFAGVSFWVWVWAVVTSFSRILLGRHFVTDVVAGAWLGVMEAGIAFRFLRF